MARTRKLYGRTDEGHSYNTTSVLRREGVGLKMKESEEHVHSVFVFLDFYHVYDSFFTLQQNFNGSNTFGTMKICSRQGWFKPMSVNHSARPGDIIGISF